MKFNKVFLICLFALASMVACAQSWQSSYDAGLKAARSGGWAEARTQFQQAAAMRTEDVSGPTTMPGPVTEQNRWRNGAPYSPNFLAAYSEYRLALAAATPEEASPLFTTAASEFEALLAKNQQSRESYYFLNQIYTHLGDTPKRMDLEQRYANAKLTFRVDTEVVSPEEMTIINGAKSTTSSGPGITVIKAGENSIGGSSNSNSGTIPNNGSPAVGTVAPLANKFALIIGNGSSRSNSFGVPYGADDAQAIREALVTHAGYPEANIDLVMNATRDQMMASAKALADRVSDGATVFIYFAGEGVNINGRDYMACVDNGSATDTATMVSKEELYRQFLPKGAKMFAFFEVPRPVVNGRYFGQEIPLVGAVAQIQSTIPGGSIYPTVRNGKTLGLFADAFVMSLQDIRSNQISISEFGWQLFNRIRGGGAERSGTGASQIPTLPVLTHLAPDEKF